MVMTTFAGPYTAAELMILKEISKTLRRPANWTTVTVEYNKRVPPSRTRTTSGLRTKCRVSDIQMEGVQRGKAKRVATEKSNGTEHGMSDVNLVYHAGDLCEDDSSSLKSWIPHQSPLPVSAEGRCVSWYWIRERFTRFHSGWIRDIPTIISAEPSTPRFGNLKYSSLAQLLGKRQYRGRCRPVIRILRKPFKIFLD